MNTDLGMQYIMDGNGNYYMLDGRNQLVVAKDRNEAGLFTFLEANRRIGGGKRARFYHTIPVATFGEVDEEINSENLPEPKTNIVAMPDIREEEEMQMEWDYDIANTDWGEFLNYFVFLATASKAYKEELSNLHSEVEKEICDLLHYVELYELTDEESLRTMDMLKDARIRRRNIKNEILYIDLFHKTVGTEVNVAKAKNCMAERKKLDSRKYHPRIRTDIFEGMEERATVVFSKELYDEQPEDYEMTYSETIYDDKENNWVEFARGQMEFYQNANQYMVNLKMKIQSIDVEIEEIMSSIEDASCNVTQGYKVFKNLKTLRNERKEKMKELEILQTMTAYIDVESMAQTYAYNMEEIQRNCGNMQMEETKENW